MSRTIRVVMLIFFLFVMFLLITLPVIIGNKWYLQVPILNSFVKKQANKNISPIDDMTKDRSYILSLAFTKNSVQLQGSVNEVNERSIQIKTKGEVHLIDIDPESVIECREKYISIPGQKPIPGYMVYIDLSRYALTLKANRDVFLKQGKVFKYSDAYKKIESGSTVSAVTKSLNNSAGGTILDLMLVYGCQ